MNKRQKQRAAVAADVIAQIKQRRFNVQTGTYVAGAVTEGLERGDDLQKVIKQKVTKNDNCEVCAMGACFISAVRLYDSFTVGKKDEEQGGIAINGLKRKVAEIFGRREMGVIEGYFEGSSSFIRAKSDTKEFELCDDNGGRNLLYKFLQYALDTEERLIFLMEAVLANPTTEVTARVLKNTLLRFFIEGRYKQYRSDFGL